MCQPSRCSPKGVDTRRCSPKGVDTRRCASKNIGPQREWIWRGSTLIGERNECQRGPWAPKGGGLWCPTLVGWGRRTKHPCPKHPCPGPEGLNLRESPGQYLLTGEFKLLRESPKRTISGNEESGLLHLVCLNLNKIEVVLYTLSCHGVIRINKQNKSTFSKWCPHRRFSLPLYIEFFFLALHSRDATTL